MIRRLTTVPRHHATTATTALKTYRPSKPSLPKYTIDEIMKNVVKLSVENVEGNMCNVYLVGTCHRSRQSCREVEAVIRHIRPQVVFLELCSSRAFIPTTRDLRAPTFAEMIDMWKKKKHNVFGLIYGWHCAKAYIRTQANDEFRVAVEEAVKCGSKIIVGDRPIDITLQRAWSSWTRLSLWDKIKSIILPCLQVDSLLSLYALDKTLAGMNDSDKVTLVIQILSKACPFLFEAFVTERDQYMSFGLLHIAREHTSVVAVVGTGHLYGIRKNWNQPFEVQKLALMAAGSFTD